MSQLQITKEKLINQIKANPILIQECINYVFNKSLINTSNPDIYAKIEKQLNFLFEIQKNVIRNTKDGLDCTGDVKRILNKLIKSVLDYLNKSENKVIHLIEILRFFYKNRLFWCYGDSPIFDKYKIFPLERELQWNVSDALICVLENDI